MCKTYNILSLIILLAILMLPVSIFAAEYLITPPSESRQSYVVDELLVKYKHGVATSQKSKMVFALGVKEIRKFGRQQQYSRIKLQKGQLIQNMLAAFRADPNVEHVQPNYLYRASVVPDDPDYDQLWGLNNITGYDIDAELAWEQRTDCRSTMVAVLDTGVDYTHQDLSSNMWDGANLGYPNHGYDFVSESIFNSSTDYDPLPMGSMEDHGTHVAGTIGAVGNNTIGTTGVCWQAQIMSVRVLDSIGVGLTSTLIQGVEFAVNNGAKVINMSLGFQGTFDQALSDAISFAKEHDVVVVVAAGNEMSDNEISNSYPCNFTQDNLVCVTALDQNYNLAGFANYGSISVDLGAPGTDILSTVPAGKTIRESLIIDPLVSDPFTIWQTNNERWTTALCDFLVNGQVISLNTLVNPASWCSTRPGTYVADTDDRVYKTFDLNDGADHAVLYYQPFIETELGSDIFSSAFDSTGGDPFDDLNSTLLLEFSGTNDTNNFYYTHDITNCRTESCSIGFRLTSNNTLELGGIGIPVVVLSILNIEGNDYAFFQGTSMATPHVAGVAALVRAYNPEYTYVETVAAIKQGGESVDSLYGITTTGNAVNAMGSLSFINQPTGLRAIVE